MAGFVLGKVCPGVKTRTGAFIAAAGAIAMAFVLMTIALIAIIMTSREDPKKANKRLPYQKEMLICYYGSGFAVFGTWTMFTIMLFGGIKVENKRALLFWMLYTLICPIYFIFGIIFTLAAGLVGPWEIVYLIAQGIESGVLIWIYLAIWVYLGEVRQRDKNPELRVDLYMRKKENEIMFAQPFRNMMTPSGTYNPGYGGPGSASSIPRSSKSRQTYAPTETESVRTAPVVGRQSRLDQYRAQAQEKPRPSSREGSAEREGGTAYYRYQYTAEQYKAHGSHHGSQTSLGHQQQQVSHDSEV